MEMDMNMNMQNAPKSSGLAIASLVLGIIGLVLSCCVPYVPLLLALLAVVLGGVSLAKKQGGKGMSIAGLICGIITLIPSILVVIYGAALMAELGL